MITVLIRSKNEEMYIAETFKAVFAQKLRDFEVILVDSGSKDKTVEIASKFDVRILKIAAKEFTYGYALNLGSKNAKGDIIVNLSAHAIPASDRWLENLVGPLNNPRVAASYGRQLPNKGCAPIEKRDLFETYSDRWKVQIQDPSFSNSNSAIKKEIWDRIPFDEKMTFAEDIHWSKQVLRSRYRIAYEPEAAVYHSHEHSTRQIYGRELNRHRARLQRGQLFAFKRLISLALEGTKEDMGFCIRNGESSRWLVYIPIYHCILLLARIQVHSVFLALNMRKRLKGIKLLRKPYNYLVGTCRYRKEWVRYKWVLLKESFRDYSDVKNILLIRTFGIGDIVRTSPIIEKIRQKFPNAKIYYFTLQKHLAVIASNPYIDRCYTEKEIEEVSKRKYDLVINWQIFDNCVHSKKLMKGVKAKKILGRRFYGNNNNHFNTKLTLSTWMEFFCQLALIPYHKKDPCRTKIYFSDIRDEKRRILDELGIKDGPKYIGICMGTDEVFRPEYWYRNFSIDFLERLIKELSKKYKLILVGCSKDRNTKDRQRLNRLSSSPGLLNLIDRLDLDELIAVVKRCSCFVSPDTGVMHMAMALKVPVVGLFSNNTGSAVISPKKMGRNYTLLYNDRPNCFPCEQMFEEECLRQRRARCIEGIPISKVVKEVDRCTMQYISSMYY